MGPFIRTSLVLLGMVAGTSLPAIAASTPPILDMHLHAYPANMMGPPPLAMCTPIPAYPTWDQSGPYGPAFMEFHKQPPCDAPVWSPETDEQVMQRTLAQMEKLNIYGVLSGPPPVMRQWLAAAPGRFYPGHLFRVTGAQPSPRALQELHEKGEMDVLGEVITQYQGIAPADALLEPYWAKMEALDIPVGIHVGPGPPGVTYLHAPKYRASLSSALTLEPVLARHPKLRIYVMHAGFPMLDDMLALMYAHPQVHVGIGVIAYTRPRKVFYEYLQAFIDAGFGKRVLFGSDQMVWPETIERAVAVINEAPFLSEAQKRDILYHNAARFLRLDEAEQARHRGE